MDLSAGFDVTCVIVVSVALVVSACVCCVAPARNRGELAEGILASRAKDNVVELFIYPRWQLGPSMSAPCVAVETLLRLAHVPYRAHTTCDASLSPTHSLPYIRHGDKCVAGTTAITQYIMDTFKVDVDSELGNVEHAVGTALRHTLLHKARFALHHTLTSRAMRYTMGRAVRCWEISIGSTACLLTWVKDNLFGAGKLAELDVLCEHYDDGYLQDLEAVEALLGGKPFLFGARPTSYDCVVYAALLPIMRLREAVFVSEPFAFAARSTVLREYVNRMSGTAFGDMEVLCRGT